MSDNNPFRIASSNQLRPGGSAERMPLTRAQLGIWLGQMLDREDPTLNLSESVEFLGAFDTQKFETALRRLVAATDSLHLQFVETQDGPRQFFDYRADWELIRLDFSSAPDPKEAAEARMLRDLKRPLRFDGGPLFRFSLMRLSADRHYWHATIHHAVIDATGWNMFLSRVAAVYSDLVAGRQGEAAVSESWLEVVASEQAYITSDRFRRDREFWQAHLAKLPQRATLSARPARKSGGLILSTGWMLRDNDPQAVARNFGASSGALLAAATAIYTHLATGERELLVGVVVSARVGTMRSVIGNMANRLPLRIAVGPDDRVGDVIGKAARDMRAALRHQLYRMEDIRRDLGLKSSDGELASTGANAMPENNDIEFAGCRMVRKSLPGGRVEDFEVRFHGGDDPAGLRVDFIANPELYDEAELEQHRDRYIELFSQIASAKTETTVGDLRLPDMAVVRPAEDAQIPSVPGEARAEAAAAPSTPTELTVAGIWADVLRIPSIIGRGDDFFDLGGDSLLANMVVARARKAFAVDLQLRVLFEAPTLMAFAGRIDEAAGEGLTAEPSIAPVAVDATAPLSSSQHRMWLIQSLDPETTAYNISGALELTGSLDAEALSQAVAELYRRHEILRTAYTLVNGEVVQHLQSAMNPPLSIVDVSGSDAGHSAAEALRRAYAQASAPIDLAKGPGSSVTLMRIGPDRHLLQMTVHHIAADQWSMGVLCRELSSLYNAARAGRPVDLPPLPVRYGDYATWQQVQLQGARLQDQLDYWRRTLDGVAPLELPTDRPRPRFQTFRGSIACASFPATLQERLKALSFNESTTLFMTMFAGFAALLHRLSGQSDIVIGIPVAGRDHGDVEQVVGTFVNTVALRVDLASNPTFRELLARVRAGALDALANQHVPFDRLVQDLVQKRDTSRAPLVQVIFNMANAPMHGIAFDGVQIKPVPIDRGGAQFDLSLSADPEFSKLVTIEYNTDLFDRSTVELFIERYLRLLEAAVAEPETRISEFDALGLQERQQVLQTWNATDADVPQETFISAFERRAGQHPNAPAATFEGATLCYGELASEVGRLAGELQALGVGRGVLVGVCQSRSLKMLVTLLAVQKAGGAYVPLDPGLPPQRLDYMIADSGLSVLVSDSGAIGKLNIPSDVMVLDADAVFASAAPFASSPANSARLTDPAYIIYTSGSTGKPKGVAVSHGALVNFLCSMRKAPGLCETDVLAAVTTISFDIAGLELYLPLLVGARIELVPSATAADGGALAELLHSRGVTVMQATPATWRMLLDAEWRGSYRLRALCGGEALPRELANALIPRVGELWNLYGPTETTIWSTACRVEPGDAPISIGKPIDNTQIYILNGKTPAPIGVAGEICIGGAGVAIGYHKRPELTAERFEADPFAAGPEARIYRTGDLGKWGADGQLYHLGRMDYQVKIRGFRIELGEIEAVLNGHPAVKQAVVTAKEIGLSDTRLVAYAVYERGSELTVSDLRRFLRQKLPEYMIPSMAIAIDRLPLTPNGKVDRNALPAPFAPSSRPANGFDPPAPGMEATIAGIWQELLKIEAIGAEDNFFDLGGHSLLALRAVAQIEKRTGTRLDPRLLFFQSLRQVAFSLTDKRVAA
jgi:nonribosomal peptide synthetase DhbF